MELTRQKRIRGWNIDIDRVINPYIPPPPRKLSAPIVLHFLGYHEHPQQPLGNIIVIIWSFIGSLSALSLIYIVCRQIPAFESLDAPLILGSFVSTAT